MGERKRVQQWFEEGRLLEPRARAPGFLDLVRALATWGGVEGAPLSTCGQDIFDSLGGREHLVLVLVDGLGLGQLETHLQGSFLHDHCRGCLQSVFPSSTPAAMVSLATGAYPSRHGVPTWWVYLEDHDLTAEMLPFKEIPMRLLFRASGEDRHA